MLRSRNLRRTMIAVLLGTISSEKLGIAQGNLPLAGAGDSVVIKRDALRVIDPHKYRIPLSIECIQTVTLVAPFDGKVKQVVLKANGKGQGQSEVVRLDNSMQKLHLARAQFAQKIANLELKAAGKEESAAAIAQAKVDLAKADVEIVEALVDQTSIRMPFAGEIQRVLVTEGQFVRAGDSIAIVADSSKMKVEIPLDRSAAEVGKTMGIKIESNEVEGKIEAVLPLPPKFDPLRELFDSIASVSVVFENGDGKLKVGQTVYVPLIPRQPVAEVPVSAIGNLADGHRKVMVIRHFIVREITVALMGQVGSSRIYVSGPFAEGDEVVYESSHQLGDGFQLKQSTGASGTSPTGANNPPIPNPANTGSKIGF